ncbi:hypothetical protein SAMN05216525_115106 [Bradyrhizobium sp. Gha]|nr:hypothetical protein SAMN05216525_115106 [Bradyrhizobium sp. Gha]
MMAPNSSRRAARWRHLMSPPRHRSICARSGLRCRARRRSPATATARIVVPTAAGDELRAYAQRILALHAEAIGALRARKPEAVIRLGVMDDYGTIVIPPLLASFAKSHPTVRVEVETGLTATMPARGALPARMPVRSALAARLCQPNADGGGSDRGAGPRGHRGEGRHSARVACARSARATACRRCPRRTSACTARATCRTRRRCSPIICSVAFRNRRPYVELKRCCTAGWSSARRRAQTGKMRREHFFL